MDLLLLLLQQFWYYAVWLILHDLTFSSFGYSHQARMLMHLQCLLIVSFKIPHFVFRVLDRSYISIIDIKRTWYRCKWLTKVEMDKHLYFHLKDQNNFFRVGTNSFVITRHYKSRIRQKRHVLFTQKKLQRMTSYGNKTKDSVPVACIKDLSAKQQ